MKQNYSRGKFYADKSMETRKEACEGQSRILISSIKLLINAK